MGAGRAKGKGEGKWVTTNGKGGAHQGAERKGSEFGSSKGAGRRGAGGEAEAEQQRPTTGRIGRNGPRTGAERADNTDRRSVEARTKQDAQSGSPAGMSRRADAKAAPAVDRAKRTERRAEPAKDERSNESQDEDPHGHARVPAETPESTGQRKERREANEATGAHCKVRKHSDIGCAVVTMETESARDMVLALVAEKSPAPENGMEKRPEIKVNECVLQLRPHIDKEQKLEIKTNIFVAWGRKAEKQNSLSPTAVAETFDTLFLEAQAPSSRSPPALAQGQAETTKDTAAPAASAKSVLATMPTQSGADAAQLCVQAGLLGQNGGPSMPSFDTVKLAMYMQAAAQHAAFTQVAQMAQQAQLAAALTAASEMAQVPQFPTPSAKVNEMRADAPSFTFEPLTQDFATSGSFGEYMNDEYDPFYYSSGTETEMPARRTMAIIDPKSGQHIDVSTAFAAEADDRPSKKPGHKQLAIIDPSTGDKVDTVMLNFTPPKAPRPLTIIDPTSGSTINV